MSAPGLALRPSDQPGPISQWSDSLTADRRSRALESQFVQHQADLEWLTPGRRVFEALEVKMSPASGRALLSDIATACGDGAAWLLHPAAGPLAGRGGSSGLAWLQFLHWSSPHVRTIDGQVTVKGSARVWSPRGVLALAPGTYDLGRLAEPVAPAGDDVAALDIDVSWDTLVGGGEAADLPEAWRSPPIEDLNEIDRAGLLEDLRTLLNALRLLGRRHPEIIAWVRSTTQVCLPIRRASDTRFKSASRRDMPGAVFFDLHTEWRHLLEALVHETAHLQLFVDEWAGPLVEIGHTQTYSSPLRPEPRPLRGILLAYHALAYMAALYRALETTEGPGGDGVVIQRKLDACRETLLGAQGGLTERGRDLVRRTEMVCAHATP